MELDINIDIDYRLFFSSFFLIYIEGGGTEAYLNKKFALEEVCRGPPIEEVSR